MYYILIHILAIFGCFAVGNPTEHFPLTGFGYHARFGIDKAARIKANEDRLGDNAIRIVGGSAAGNGQFPHQAGLIISLENISGRSVCGAVLIQNNRLLTAAHCWDDGFYKGTLLEVVLGSTLLFTGGTRVLTSDVEVHSEWDPNTLINDIAIIRINEPVEISVIINPASLPSSYIGEDFVAWSATVSGYGKTLDAQVTIPTTTTLSFVHLSVISNNDCTAIYGSTFVKDSTLCATGTVNGQSSCASDDGGPLIVYAGGQAILIGIVSFHSGLGCELGYPVGLTRTTQYLDWITTRL